MMQYRVALLDGAAEIQDWLNAQAGDGFRLAGMTETKKQGGSHAVYVVASRASEPGSAPDESGPPLEARR